MDNQLLNEYTLSIFLSMLLHVWRRPFNRAANSNRTILSRISSFSSWSHFFVFRVPRLRNGSTMLHDCSSVPGIIFLSALVFLVNCRAHSLLIWKYENSGLSRKNFSPRRDLNRGPPAPKANALTTMLRCSSTNLKLGLGIVTSNYFLTVNLFTLK